MSTLDTAAPATAASDPDLARLQVLYGFKELLDRDGPINVTPFTEDRIVCYGTEVSKFDVPAIHKPQRDLIRKALAEVHERQTAQVILLSGSPGMGKSHLIRHFASPELVAADRFVFVRPGNDWRVSEFQTCLLDSILAALVQPSPMGPNLLIDRIEAIAFTAVGHLLQQPDSLMGFRPRAGRGRLRRFFARLFGSFRSRIARLHGVRNPALFRLLDFDAFSGYVCDRFLAEPGNPLHRHVLRVLLCALFPHERENVVNWLSRRLSGGHFARKLGVEEKLDGSYERMAAVRLLVSLFGREVSAGLRGRDGESVPDLVFFLAFDQTEGRDELFESDDDWFTFFAYLSELYNSLPNVLILFTMTLGLRDRLHARMEKQFQDRIRRDEHSVLRYVEDAEVLELYRRRLDRWLGAGQASLRRQIEECGNPYLPFDRSRVLEMAEHQTLRDMQEVFDTRFRMELLTLAFEVERDYRLWRRELKQAESGDPFKDTESHQETVLQLLKLFGEVLAGRGSVRLREVEVVRTEEGNHEVLQLTFTDQDDERRWVRVFLARLSQRFNNKAQACVRLLSHRQRNLYSLWLLRANSLPFEVDAGREQQVHCCVLPPEQETDLRAVIRVLEKKEGYRPDDWQKGVAFLVDIIERTYLGDLFHQAAESLRRLNGTSSSPEDSEDQ
jgi:hypothetical protein